MNGTPTKRPMTSVDIVHDDGYKYTDIRTLDEHGNQTHGAGCAFQSYAPFDGPPITESETRANAALWAEASTVYAETGLTPQELFQLVPPAMLAHCIHYKAAKGGAR